MKKKNKIFITSTLSLLGAGAILLGTTLNIQAESTTPAKQISNITSIVQTLETTQPTIYCSQRHENCDSTHAIRNQETGTHNCDDSGMHHANGKHHENRN